MKWPFRKKDRKVTLVLGGGSARGVAHIGVLTVLVREKVPIHSIVGTSMGAIIGAAYSVGVSLEEMREKAYKVVINKLLDPTVPTIGLLAGDKMELVIRDLVNNKEFTDCKIPLAVVATDIENGKAVVYEQGDLIKAVRASCSWPGIFNPVRLDGKLLSDGGIKHSVPTKIAQALGADYIIAVDVGFCVKKGKIENIFQMIMQSFQITGEELNRYQSSSADAVIKVDLGDEIDQLAYEKAREIIEKGIIAAEAKVSEIKYDLGIK